MNGSGSTARSSPRCDTTQSRDHRPRSSSTPATPSASNDLGAPRALVIQACRGAGESPRTSDGRKDHGSDSYESCNLVRRSHQVYTIADFGSVRKRGACTAGLEKRDSNLQGEASDPACSKGDFAPGGTTPRLDLPALPALPALPDLHDAPKTFGHHHPASRSATASNLSRFQCMGLILEPEAWQADHCRCLGAAALIMARIPHYMMPGSRLNRPRGWDDSSGRGTVLADASITSLAVHDASAVNTVVAYMSCPQPDLFIGVSRKYYRQPTRGRVKPGYYDGAKYTPSSARNRSGGKISSRR